MNGHRFLLDQMLDTDVGNALHSDGYDVLRVSEIGMARSDDENILSKAIALGRILITLDEDFGDWAVLPLQNHTGVIRLKVNQAISDNILAVLIPFLRQFLDKSFANTLVIVSNTRVRWIQTGI